MRHHRRTGCLLAAAVLAACVDSPSGPVPEPQLADVPPSTVTLLVFPGTAEMMPGDTQEFAAYVCPVDADGEPIVGGDGVPGTEDDDCVDVTAAWTVEGDIGSISPLTGAMTTLTAALPAGSTTAMGAVRAEISGQDAWADVFVSEPDSEPIALGKTCIQFTSGGTSVGDKVCKDGATQANFTFDRDSGAQATFKDLKDPPPDDPDPQHISDGPEAAIGFSVRFAATGQVTAAFWIQGTASHVKIGRKDPAVTAKVNSARKVDLAFTGTGARIKGASFNGRNGAIDIAAIEKETGKTIDDAHVTYEPGAASSGSGQ